MAFYEDNPEDYQVVPGIKLKEEQIDGIDFALRNRDVILNLKPGTGKTLCALVIGYKIMSKSRDTLTFIVCPKKANSAFKKELALMKFKYSILTTDETEVNNKGRFFIFNYSNIDRMVTFLHSVRERGIKVIGIFDEVHLLGSNDSNLAQVMRVERGGFSKVVGLTGTPLLNNIEGLYNVVQFVSPWFLGRYTDFSREWLITKQRRIRLKGGRQRNITEIVGYSDLEGLREKLEKIIITRGRDYPLNYFYRSCSLIENEMSYYKTAARGILDRDITDEEKVVTARLWDLQKVVDGSSEFMESEVMYSKFKLLIETLREILSRGEGCLVYTEMEDTYKIIGEVIEKYKGYLGYKKLWYITGKVAFKKRLECEKQLKAGDICIITKAGNSSINLQAVNNVIFYNLPFALGDFIQTVGRVARTDSVYDNQNVYILEVKDTIDTYKRLLLQSNMTLVQAIFGKDRTMPYYGDVEQDVMKKYRQYFKNKMLWCK